MSRKTPLKIKGRDSLGEFMNVFLSLVLYRNAVFGVQAS